MTQFNLLWNLWNHFLKLEKVIVGHFNPIHCIKSVHREKKVLYNNKLVLLFSPHNLVYCKEGVSFLASCLQQFSPVLFATLIFLLSNMVRK